MDKLCEKYFVSLCDQYKTKMEQFRACKPEGEISEANLVFSFIMQFLESDKNAIWAVEVPFKSRQKTTEETETQQEPHTVHWRRHLDALIYSKGTLYLIEAKRDNSYSEFFTQVGADLARIVDPKLTEAISHMRTREGIYSNQMPEVEKVIGILLADTWRDKNQKHWSKETIINQLKNTEGYEQNCNGTKKAINLISESQSGLEMKTLPISGVTEPTQYHLMIAVTQDLNVSMDKINGHPTKNK